jgi:outer membrane protein
MTLPRRFFARSLVAALAFGLCVPHAADAQVQSNAQPIQVPTPAAMPTTSGSPLPYPAYGSPAPDVSAQQAHPNVPATVTLTQAIDIAVAESPAFASDRAVYRAIAAKYGAEQGALFPSISASGSIERTPSNSNSNINGTTLGKILVTTETGSISVQELIFDGGQVIAGIRSAKEASTAGRDTLLRDVQSLAFTVATDYFTLLEDNATVASDNALVKEFEVNEQFVVAQIRTGAAARSDLAAAQFETAQARGQLVTAQGAAIAAEGTFATALGLDADTEINPQLLEKSPPQTKALSYMQALQEALSLRPDYLAAQHTVESDKEGLRFAKLARFPTLSANTSVGTERQLLQSPPSSPPFFTTKQLGLTMTVPIYDQGITNFNVATAAATLDEAKAALISSRLQVQSDVRGGLANLISTRANLIQAQAEVTSAQVSLQATQAQYRVGASTITAIVTAEANLATAQSAYVAALYGERLAEQQYTFALGVSDLTL